MIQKNSGFIFLEVLLAIALGGIVFVTLFGIIFQLLNLSPVLQKTTQADALLRGELEAVRAFRDANTWSTFTNVTLGDLYYFSVNNSQWTRNSGSENVGNVTRSVIFDQDASWDASVGSFDVLKATITVAGEGKTYQIITYLTNWQKK